MVAVISENNPNLLLLNELADFQAHALKMIKAGTRQICVLSKTLDAPLYNTDELYDAVRIFATQNRYAHVRFLVKDTKPMIEHGHLLLQLARRLSGKVDVRKLTEAPRNINHAWLIVDDALLLYKRDEDAYNGYAAYATASKCKLLLEEFTTLWELYGEEDPNLRQYFL